MCVNGYEKGNHFICCRQVVSESNLYNPQYVTGPQARMELDTLCTDLAEEAQEVYMHAVVHVAKLTSAISHLMYDNCSELPGTEVTFSPNLPAV